MSGFHIYTALVLMLVSASFADEFRVDLSKIDRTIVHEPNYRYQPHYALLVFGHKAEHRSWLVIDGDSVAYIDRQGNGDLTDPADRVELDVEATNKIKLGSADAYKAMNVFPLGEVAGIKLIFQLWVRNPDFDASKDEFYRKHFREWDENNWINGSLMRIAKDGSQSQNPLLLTARSADAQVAHFDGRLTFEAKWLDKQQLEPWPKQTLFDVYIGTGTYWQRTAKNRDSALLV